jgi:hypothetical protein
VINSAGGFIPRLAEVCLSAVNAVRLPVAINMYLTNPGQRTSAPPHTDKQDVFVLQTSGYKHWRVFAPPQPSVMFRADPFARGKAKDLLTLEEMGPPLIETTLAPGQLLYIPAGFPHTTDTINDIPADSAPSVHLTIGVDTLIWGLSYGGLRDIALRRAGLDDKLVPTKLPNEVYWDLQVHIHTYIHTYIHTHTHTHTHTHIYAHGYPGVPLPPPPSHSPPLIPALCLPPSSLLSPLSS